jgi:integrase
VFTSEEIFRFVKDADGLRFLMLKLIIIFCFFGALRVSECVVINKSDVKLLPDGLLVKIVRKKTDKATLGQTFLVPLEHVDMYKEYLNLTKNCNCPRLWLTFEVKKDKFKNSPMGVNLMRKIPSIVATFLGLENPLEYTGHSLRASAATALVDSGVSMENLKRHGQWKSTSVVEGYIQESKKMKTDIATALSNSSPVPLPIASPVSKNSDLSSTASTNYAGPVFVNCVFEGNFMYEKK